MKKLFLVLSMLVFTAGVSFAQVGMRQPHKHHRHHKHHKMMHHHDVRKMDRKEEKHP